MSLTINQARDEILVLLKAALDASAQAGTKVIYDNTKEDIPTDATKWVRLTVQHNTGRQATLSGELGQRRFRRGGVVFAQIFVPVNTGHVVSDALATVYKDAMEGASTSGGVVFSDVRPNEIGSDGDWFQLNLIAEFRYDEIR